MSVIPSGDDRRGVGQGLKQPFEEARAEPAARGRPIATCAMPYSALPPWASTLANVLEVNLELDARWP